nr:tetratricopeptide repeat protein [Candidatus Saccharibacteria bacterium]NIV03078.1 tetratricopeptide repeat protein [Calditrichia bacterium]NIW77933.1 tetratricopeptide repeat protein [Calditrichia bacterium]
MKLRRLTYILTVLLIAGCSSSKQIVQQTTPKQTQTPQKAVEHYLAGSLQDFQEHYKEALLEYYKALLYDSTSAQILKAIGRDLIRMQQNESAIEYLKRALKYNSEDKEIIYYLAEAYYNQKDKEKALQYFERFHALDPYNSMVHSNLIYLYSQLGKEEKLIALRKELAEASGYQSESAYQLLNLYVKLDRLIKARQLAQKMIDEEPDYYKNWAVYGNVLELDDDTTGAITAYKKALELEPNAEETLTDLYFLYARSGNWQALVETFGEIVAKDSTYDRARLLLAEGYFNLENYEKAQQTVQPLLKDSEFKQQAYLLSGRIAANENRLEDARAN